MSGDYWNRIAWTHRNIRTISRGNISASRCGRVPSVFCDKAISTVASEPTAAPADYMVFLYGESGGGGKFQRSVKDKADSLSLIVAELVFFSCRKWYIVGEPGLGKMSCVFRLCCSRVVSGVQNVLKVALELELSQLLNANNAEQKVLVRANPRLQSMLENPAYPLHHKRPPL